MKRILIAAMLLLIGAGSAFGHGLHLDYGLADYQVVQCDETGKAAFLLGGLSDAQGAMDVVVEHADTGRKVKTGVITAQAADGKWEARVEGVPAGGPYRVVCKLRGSKESVAAENILVGDLWLLAGQSNMQGVGNLVAVEEPDPQVHLFAMDRRWRMAQEPLHILAESPDAVHYPQDKEAERAAAIAAARQGAKGAGLGLSFAREMVKRTGRPVGLVATAHGGTSMEQWNPARRDEGGASLYGSMYQSFLEAGGKVRGVLWYQGESDAGPEPVQVYREKMEALIAAFRSDLGDPTLPFYIVQLGRFVVESPNAAAWNRVQADQLAITQSVPHTGLAPAVDLALDDLIHIGTPGLKTLGRRMAKLAEHDLYGGTVLHGPRLARVERFDTRYGKGLRVHFTGVNGGLRAAGRLSGFSLSQTADGPDLPCIYKQEIDPENPAAVLLWVQKMPEPTVHLWHGRGYDPYCNLTDAEDMAVPVFGPVPVP
jgi:sialate O-acetylesterase